MVTQAVNDGVLQAKLDIARRFTEAYKAHAGVHVAVRADQRQACHLAVEVFGDFFLARIGAEEAVGWERGGSVSHRVFSIDWV